MIYKSTIDIYTVNHAPLLWVFAWTSESSHLSPIFTTFASTIRYEDSVDNTVQENSSVFALIRMRWLPSARACGAEKLHQQNPPVLNWRCRLT